MSKRFEKYETNEYSLGQEGMHEAFANAMGKLIFAPIASTESGLRILDSGCNNGRWLRDLAKQFPSEANEYVGTDALYSVLPSGLPKNFKFFEQDVCKAWPQDWSGTFDLVHQRTVLVNARKIPLQDILRPMVDLLEFGGWIQLMEADFEEEPGNGPALHEFLKLGSWFFDVAGPGRNMGPSLKGELEDTGLRNVQNQVVQVAFGAQLKGKAPETVIRSTVEGLCSAIPGSLVAIQDMEHPFCFDSLSTLEDRLRQELLEYGGHIRYNVVWGQR